MFPKGKKDQESNFLKSANRPKELSQSLTDFLKLCFGLGCFSYSLKLATDDYGDNPALFDAKMYYVFISLFLILQGLDALIDSCTERMAKSNDDAIRITFAGCLHCCIFFLYVPFIGIGYRMSQSRMATSWDDRLDSYLRYEIDLVGDQSEPLENSY